MCFQFLFLTLIKFENMKSSKSILLVFGLSLLIVACVPARKFEDMKGKYETCQEEVSGLKRANQSLEASNTELNAKIEDLTKIMDFMAKDTTVLGRSLRTMTKNYDQLDKTYRELLSLRDKMKEGNEKEIQMMQEKINKTQAELLSKEDELRELESDLNEKSDNLDRIKSDLEATKMELESREARVQELERILHRKDSVVNALKEKVASALYGFEGEGLTVQLKNGKVYVSLENQLLFKSGSYTVDEKGKTAIRKLATVLAKNPDINVVVEGHTDTDQYNGTGALKDNWDLSVIRATQIVKILLENKEIEPKRISAAGRGEFIPVIDEDTPEAKGKNRRIEIILTPKLDELFEILDAN